MVNNENKVKTYLQNVSSSRFKECGPNRHKLRDNAFDVTWCVKCGRLFTKPCGKPLQESDKITVHCA